MLKKRKPLNFKSTKEEQQLVLNNFKKEKDEESEISFKANTKEDATETTERSNPLSKRVEEKVDQAVTGVKAKRKIIRAKTRPKPKLQKREQFKDKNIRVTTYLQAESQEKLKEIKENYNIPIKETINNALKEYFTKYQL